MGQYGGAPNAAIVLAITGKLTRQTPGRHPSELFKELFHANTRMGNQGAERSDGKFLVLWN